MNRAPRRLRVALLCLGALAFGRSAWADVTFCNNGNDTVRYAMLVDDSILPVLFPDWQMVGWHELRPRECRRVLRGQKLYRIHISAQDPEPGGRWRLRLPVLSGSGPGELTANVFCVRDSTFHRSEARLEMHSQCPEGWYRQLFNIYIHVPSDVSFTFTF